jgi:hypothetical protein
MRAALSVYWVVDLTLAATVRQGSVSSPVSVAKASGAMLPRAIAA